MGWVLSVTWRPVVAERAALSFHPPPPALTWRRWVGEGDGVQGLPSAFTEGLMPKSYPTPRLGLGCSGGPAGRLCLAPLIVSWRGQMKPAWVQAPWARGLRSYIKTRTSVCSFLCNT